MRHRSQESARTSDNMVNRNPVAIELEYSLNDPGKLQGAKLVALFNELMERKVIISIHVVGTGFERLTCIAAIQCDTVDSFLLIDRPDGFSQSVGQTEEWNLRFNFNGPDQLEYVFHTRGGENSGDNLKVPFPEFVERLQRRKDFRILTVPGTKLVFVDKKVKGVVELINISLGGAFGLLQKYKSKNPGGSPLALEQRLYKVGLIFPADKEATEQMIVVDKVEVRRIEHERERKLYKYAFEFMDIAKDQKQKLTQAIYHIQRQYLKNR
jgi:c-di-GMP-binding flagellar brake protein YcgR